MIAYGQPKFDSMTVMAGGDSADTYNPKKEQAVTTDMDVSTAIERLNQLVGGLLAVFDDLERVSSFAEVNLVAIHASRALEDLASLTASL